MQALASWFGVSWHNLSTGVISPHLLKYHAFYTYLLCSKSLEYHCSGRIIKDNQEEKCSDSATNRAKYFPCILIKNIFV